MTKKTAKAKAKKNTGKKQSDPTVVTFKTGNGRARKIKDPVENYGYRQIFVPCEYDLTLVNLYEDGESYVRQAFQKKTALMFKEGEVYTGRNEETVAYIKKRIRQIEYVTDMPWRQLLKITGKELISKSNFFWVKVRSNVASGGDVGHKRALPIAGYFPMSAENVKVKKDDTGQIIAYRQEMPGGKWKEWKPADVIHWKYNVRPGFTFGIPQIMSVIPDIQVLRRLEENVEVLFYQTLFPLFQYKVGTETKPASTITLADGSVMDEVSYVRQQIQKMPSEGGIVTPERHELKYIGAEGQIPDFNKVLQYFKNRILAGLGISGLDIGEGDSGNRATADSLSKGLIDSVKDFQDTFEQTMNTQVLNELLMEGDFKFDPLMEENVVEMKFIEIDIEEQMKKNVNAQLMFNSDIWDINEAREITGKQGLREEQEKLMFTERQTIRVMNEEQKAASKLTAQQHEHALVQAKHGASLQPATEKVATTTGGGKKTVTRTVTKPNSKAKAAANSGKAASKPTNQHGTKTGPQKSRLDHLIRNESLLLKDLQKTMDKDSLQYMSCVLAATQRIKKRVAAYNDEVDAQSVFIKLKSI